MTEIDLSGNRLSFLSLETVLGKIVRMLNVSDSHESYQHLFSFKSINLRNNAFSSFDISLLGKELFGTFVNFFFKVRLNFGNFVFNCDCRMFRLYRFLHLVATNGFRPLAFASYYPFNDGAKTSNYDLHGFNCLHPVELRGKPLIEVPITAFGCEVELPTCPNHCRCWVRTVDQTVKANCSDRNCTRLPSSVPNGSFALDLSNNELIELPEVPDYVQFLQVLDLSGNRLQRLNQNILKT